MDVCGFLHGAKNRTETKPIATELKRYPCQQPDTALMVKIKVHLRFNVVRLVLTADQNARSLASITFTTAKVTCDYLFCIAYD